MNNKMINSFLPACSVLMMFFYSFALAAKPIEFAHKQETKFGESLYLEGQHELYGRHRIKLTPQDYPLWKLRTDSAFFKMQAVELKVASDRPEDVQGEYTQNYPFSRKSQAYNLITLPSKKVQGPLLGRPVYLYLPTDFSPKRSSIIFYFHDGQNLFLETTTAPDSYALEQWFGRFAANYPEHQLIVVGISNSSERLREYLPPEIDGPAGRGTGDLYRQFVEEQVVPVVEERYLGIQNPVRYIGGSSLGGIISLYFLQSPKRLWSGAFAQSPSFQLEGTQLLVEQLSPENRLYLDNGTIGPSNDNYDRTYYARDFLLHQGFVFGKNLWHQVGNLHRHRESDWAQRLPWALDFFLRY
jgi:predicted alpha/beta superfamily hydrolase